MEQFKIRPNGFKEVLKKMLLRTIPIILLIIIVAVLLPELNANKNNGEVSVLPFMIPLLIFSIGLGLFIGINKQKKIFDSFNLSINDDGTITREQFNTPIVTIPKHEILTIIKDKNGVFTIKGKDNLNIIRIPAQIEKYTELEKKLNAIHPITEQITTPFKQQLMLPVVFLSLGLMATLYISMNKVIVAITGTLLAIIVIWSFIEIQRSKNIDVKTKRSSYWTILVLLFIIGQMYLKLSV